jgi:hypothetical protein
VPYSPISVVVGPGGKIFVSGYSAGADKQYIYIYNSSARYLGRYGGYIEPGSRISVDAEGVVWVAQTVVIGHGQNNAVVTVLRIDCLKAV